MSVIESDQRAIAHRRLIPVGVRFAPEFLKEIGAAVPGSGDVRARGMLGLLFGKTESNLVSLEAFFPVTADCAIDAQSCDEERLERALDQMLLNSKLRPGIAVLELVGWCSFQATDGLMDAAEGCISFHARRFRRASDVLLMLQPGQRRELSGQVYARLSELPFSPEHCASGRIAIDLERRVTRPVYVSVVGAAESAHAGLYFRTYESAKALEKAERKEARREAFRRMREWRTPQWLSTLRPAEAVVKQSNVVVVSPARAATPQMAVVRPLYDLGPLQGPSRGSLGWLLGAAVVLLMAMGLALAFFHSRSRVAWPAAVVSSPAPQNGGLGLRVHVQGEGFLVTWDREAPAMRSATKGVLRIQDGSEQRNTDLQPAELSNGSIVYRPGSDDVNFLLTVYAADGSVTREGVRALDGPQTSTAEAPDGVPKAPAVAATATRRTEHRSRAVRTEQTTDAVPAWRSEVVPKSGAPGYTAPEPLKIVMPDLTRLAPASLPAEGKVDVDVDVDEQGRVVTARIPAGAPRVSTAVARAAIAAAKQWRFEPAKLQGRSVASKHHVIFDFHAGAR